MQTTAPKPSLLPVLIAAVAVAASFLSPVMSALQSVSQ